MFERGIKVSLFLAILAVLGIVITAIICFISPFGFKSLLDITPDILEISIYAGLGAAATGFLSLILLFFQREVHI